MCLYWHLPFEAAIPVALQFDFFPFPLPDSPSPYFTLSPFPWLTRPIAMYQLPMAVPIGSVAPAKNTAMNVARSAYSIRS